MVVLTVPKPLAAGPATIHITYTGILNSEMRGLYLGKDDQGRKYAATQFEATDARRAFPSFDEPDYKATFDITALPTREGRDLELQSGFRHAWSGRQAHGEVCHDGQDVLVLGGTRGGKFRIYRRLG